MFYDTNKITKRKKDLKVLILLMIILSLIYLTICFCSVFLINKINTHISLFINITSTIIFLPFVLIFLFIALELYKMQKFIKVAKQSYQEERINLRVTGKAITYLKLACVEALFKKGEQDIICYFLQDDVDQIPHKKYYLYHNIIIGYSDD